MTSADHWHVVQITAAIYGTICTCEPGEAFMGDFAGLHAVPALLRTATQYCVMQFMRHACCTWCTDDGQGEQSHCQTSDFNDQQ